MENLFPLRDGMSWTFEDRLDPDAARLVLTLRKKPLGGYSLEGGRRSEKIQVAWREEFLELSHEGQIVDRILRYPGKAGDTWVVNQAIFTIFGYDEVRILGEKRRALVVAADRRQMREIAWFVQDMGWVRIRTEHRGRPIHDTFLVAYEPGRMN
ncbi:MAG: hypothetical protein ACYTHK_04520 [Planctomycetota bacterium]